MLKPAQQTNKLWPVRYLWINQLGIYTILLGHAS